MMSEQQRRRLDLENLSPEFSSEKVESIEKLYDFYTVMEVRCLNLRGFSINTRVCAENDRGRVRDRLHCRVDAVDARPHAGAGECDEHHEDDQLREVPAPSRHQVQLPLPADVPQLPRAVAG